MREKGKNRGLETGIFGIVYEEFQYLAVPQMDSIKRSDGNGCLKSRIRKLRNAIDCFHLIEKIKKAYF